MSPLLCSLEEICFHLLHLLSIFFGHGPSEQIGLAQSKTCITLSYLHNLFLIEHDAIGRSQNICDGFIQQVNTFLAVLTLDEVIRIITGTGTIETGGRNQVFKAVWFDPLQKIDGPWLLKLENALGLACGKELQGLLIFQVNVFNHYLNAIFFSDSFFHLLGKGQIAQTQEVHLEQTIGLNSMGIILGNQHILSLLERDDIGQIIVAHHHASGMDGGLPWLALDGLGQSEGLLILGLAVDNLTEGGISFIGRG